MKVNTNENTNHEMVQFTLTKEDRNHAGDVISGIIYKLDFMADAVFNEVAENAPLGLDACMGFHIVLAECSRQLSDIYDLLFPITPEDVKLYEEAGLIAKHEGGIQ